MEAAIGNELRILTEQELCPALLACPVCGHDDNRHVIALQPNPPVKLLRCGHCHTSYSSRMPTKEALDSYYARYYAQPKYRGLPEAVHFSRPERLARHLQAFFAATEGTTFYIADFGGGDGTVSLLLAERLLAAGAKEVDITLVDYEAPKLPADSRIRIRPENKVENLLPDSFDLIIASASLEHVPDLQATLLALLTAMKRGGRFYARTPYMAPLIRLAEHFGVHIGFGYPAHLFDLGAEFWNRLPQTLGLEGSIRILASRPSIVESTFNSAPLRSVVAYMLKWPGYILGERYGLVGGWEVVMERITKK